MIFEEKRKKTAIIFAKNILAWLLVVGIVGLSVFLVQGWQVDEKGEPKRTGLVQFHSNPTEANVKINGQILSEKTNTKKQLDAGKYDFSIEKSGYHAWQKTANVEVGRILWLNYARLIPKKIESANFFEYKNIKNIEISGDKKRAFASVEDLSGVLRFFIFDLEDKNLAAKEIVFTAEIFNLEATTEEEKSTQLNKILATNKIEELNESGTRAIMEFRNGEKSHKIIANLENPQESFNLSENFGLNFTKIVPIEKDFSKFLTLANEEIKEIDLNSKTISANIASHVGNLEVFDGKIIAFWQKNQNGNFTIKISDKKKSATIATTKTEPKIAIGRYFNENYIHIESENEVKIYRGNDWLGQNQPKLWRKFALENHPKKISLNGEGRMLKIEGDKTLIIDLEYAKLHTIEGSDWDWLDNFTLYRIDGENLIFSDFDGFNKREILHNSHQKAWISPNNKFLFSIKKNASGNFSLNRSKLTIE